ncbi:hypothetical protein RvY_00191-2 [Ramazzottius varieornatus]|uniref:U2A'/phosphoprotein 32 family A C-terminal domain-containing protein n=1 Tax=Ramazzottius varieornatus TaxID=947166 RepID=A0A1D1UG14_RAMVA|nr:hypothetical protein RvY_00191-2 [Ramazzottius varieornatus]
MGITVLPRLKNLVMMDNPVQLEVDFRMVIIARMPTLAVLDKEAIKPYDRDWSIMTLLDSLYHEQVDLKVAVEDLMDAIDPVEMADTATLPPSQTSLTSETDFMEDEDWEDGEEADDEVNEVDVVERTNSKDLLETKSIEEDDLDREYYGEKEPKEDEEDQGEQET